MIYFYKTQNGTLCPPPAVSIFGASKMTEFILKARLQMSKMEVQDLPIIPHIFGWNKAQKICTEQGMEWLENEDEEVYISCFLKTLHIMLSGVTGGGKSNALTQWLLAMLYFTHPQLLRLWIFDPKGDFKAFEKIARVEKYDTAEPLDILLKMRSLDAFRQKKQEFIKRQGFNKIEELNDFRLQKKQPLMKYDVVVVDEFASLADNVGGVRMPLMHIMEKGRSAGVFLLTTGQRLGAREMGGKEFGGRVKANIIWSWSFAQRDATNARIAGVKGASKGLPTGTSILSSPKKDNLVETVLVTKSDCDYALKKMHEMGMVFK